MKTLVSAIVPMLALIGAALHAQTVPPVPDRIFAADFTHALAIQGNAGYAGAPKPGSETRVRVHFIPRAPAGKCTLTLNAGAPR